MDTASKEESDSCNFDVGYNTVTDTLSGQDEFKKQKRRNRKINYDSRFTWTPIWKILTGPNTKKLLQKAEIAYENNDFTSALEIYTQLLGQFHRLHCIM